MRHPEEMACFFNPLVLRRPIERIKTYTLGASFTQSPICSIYDTNGCVDKLVLINDILVDMFHLPLIGKGLCHNMFVVIRYKLIVCLIDVQHFGILFGGKDVILCAKL